MQRRAYLLFVLFLVVVVFYASVTRESLPEITAEQRTQTEQLNQLDEFAMKPADTPETSSGN